MRFNEWGQVNQAEKGGQGPGRQRDSHVKGKWLQREPRNVLRDETLESDRGHLHPGL